MDKTERHRAVSELGLGLVLPIPMPVSPVSALKRNEPEAKEKKNDFGVPLVASIASSSRFADFAAESLRMEAIRRELSGEQ